MSYVQLTREERYVIAHLKMFKLSLREIARRLNHHHSTTSRELKRNGRCYPGGEYWYWYDNAQAQARALERKPQPRHHRRRAHPALYQYVVRRLQALWSTEYFAGLLALDYPRAIAMRVNQEAIYRQIFRDTRTDGQIYRYLRLAHWRRRTQRR